MENPWVGAYRLFSMNLKRAIFATLLCAMIGFGLGLIAKTYMPRTYHASAQLLFDPQGLKVFTNDIKTGFYDANSAINYVESQMLVIQSERVLSRVIKAECGAAKPLRHAFSKYCAGADGQVNWAKALPELDRAMKVYRGGRSFVVTVQAMGSTPEAAARLATAIVNAYRDEEADMRARTSRKLTAGLTARLTQLRRKLADSEARAEQYTQSKNLLRVDGKLAIEQELSSVTAALNQASSRVVRAGARLRQLKSSRLTPDSLAAFGAAANAQSLAVLIASRDRLQAQAASLATRAGRRHPGMIKLRGQIAKVNRSISVQSGAIRQSLQEEFNAARAEKQTLRAEVDRLTRRFARADKARIELRAIGQEIAANRKLVETFETRARETSEYGRIDSGNLRVVSVARTPAKGRFWPRFILAGLIGMVIGIMVAIGGVMLTSLIALSRKQAAQHLPPVDQHPAMAGQYSAQVADHIAGQASSQFPEPVTGHYANQYASAAPPPSPAQVHPQYTPDYAQSAPAAVNDSDDVINLRQIAAEMRRRNAAPVNTQRRSA